MAANDQYDYIPSSILVTGGLGFIGSHVVIHLARYFPDYRIIVLDKLDSCASRRNLHSVENRVKIIIGDILSRDLINHILAEYKIDTVMHFAAQTHVDNSFDNSLSFTENNVMGTHNLLEAATHSLKNGGVKINRFIHVSTDEVYGETNEIRQEDMILTPTNPYAASKAAAEHIVRSYYNSFNLPIIISRGNNVYGPHQYPEKLIPKFINRLMRNLPCCIHGNGSNSRSFIYVSDAVNAFITLLHNGEVGETYNIASEFEISNLAVAKDLIKLMKSNKTENHIEFVEDRRFNDRRYKIDGHKLRNLGWTSNIEWFAGLALTIKWYKDNINYWPEIESALKPHPNIK